MPELSQILVAVITALLAVLGWVWQRQTRKIDAIEAKADDIASKTVSKREYREDLSAIKSEIHSMRTEQSKRLEEINTAINIRLDNILSILVQQRTGIDSKSNEHRM